MDCDILNLEWASKGRDIDIVEPVLSYLEIKYNLNIKRGSIAFFEQELWSANPRIFLIASDIGASENLIAAKLASNFGIKVVTLTSEGDYIEDPKAVKVFFWGHNKEEHFFEDLQLEWSFRNLNLIHKNIAGSDEFNIKVSGATGFDRYRYSTFMDKNIFLNKYKKERFSKVIGIPAWSFDQFLGNYGYRKEVEERYGERDTKIHKESKDKLRNIIIKLIEQNPDILFVLKFHPGTIDEEHTELFGLDSYSNTIAIRGQTEQIADVINVSDVWVAYDSTTCLEAWLLGKQTMLINPITDDFNRSRIAKGSPIIRTFEEAQEALGSFYNNDSLPNFKELESKRREIIEQVIQWDDGKNHIRAAEYIYELFSEKTVKRKHVNIFVIKRLLRFLLVKLLYASNLCKWQFFKRKLFSYEYLKSIYDPVEREAQHQRIRSLLKDFYAENNIEV